MAYKLVPQGGTQTGTFAIFDGYQLLYWSLDKKALKHKLYELNTKLIKRRGRT